MPSGFQKGHKIRNTGRTWFKKGEPSLRKGIRLSEEIKEKLSKAKRGKRSNAWKDGRSKSKEWYSWAKNKRNRLLNSGVVGVHTFGEWELLKKQYGYTCPCCKQKEPEIKLTIDHIIPLSKGGSDYIENIQPLCRSCNCKKHTKIIKY